ncbi:MAG: hypothetical protein K6G28_01690 [Acholeplasmatales bacterium]|nr:hypothetical protein [Acholeplasmatales bacterium]
MKPTEEIYFTEVGFDKFEVLTIDVFKETYSISYSNEQELDVDAIVMDPKTYKAFKLGLEQKFTRK